MFEVAEGALSTDGAFVVMAANPTRQSGYFFDSHHKMRSSWSALHWDGTKSPMVSRDYIGLVGGIALLLVKFIKAEAPGVRTNHPVEKPEPMTAAAPIKPSVPANAPKPAAARVGL